MRSSFKATLKFKVLSIPVKAYTTTPSANAAPQLNQLHSACKSRMRQKLTCPCCGDVDRKDIERGYEFAKDQYVIIDPNELKSEDKSIDVVGFVKPGKIHDRYRSGKTYYLAAEDIGQKAYHLLAEAMRKKKMDCFAKAIVLGKEQLVLIRSIEGALVLNVLHYADEIRGPEALPLGEAAHTKEELTIALDLIEATTVPDVQMDSYSNPYNARLREIIEAKVDGKEIVSPPAAEDDEAPVINLMDALQKSLEAMDGPKRAKSARSRRKQATA